jgi:pterin-4a-carbinolamine dehydratase
MASRSKQPAFLSKKRVGFSNAGETLLWHHPDMLVRYARVPTLAQNLDLQCDALTNAG